MNRIEQVFKDQDKKILTIYFTAGYPELNDTLPILKALDEAEVDIIEIGMPYSDPLADGPTIQESSKQALANGMNLSQLFDQLADLRKITQKPVLLMGYSNNVLQFGVERFCKHCHEVGIDGLILPDMPLPEYKVHFADIFAQYELKNVFLITPKTSEERITEIDEQKGGFIYMVSSSSTTQQMQLKTPRMVGFGIQDKQAFDLVNQYADGAIVGSAFIKALNRDHLEKRIFDFVDKLRTS
jgi:tryptophan synthase alpha chain